MEAGVPNRCFGLLTVFGLLIPGSELGAQAGSVLAESYPTRFGEVMALGAAPDGVAEVHDLLLQRDAGRFRLRDGTLYLLSPIGGRIIGALFRGSGTFSFAPPTKVEQDRLARYEKQTALDAPRPTCASR